MFSRWVFCPLDATTEKQQKLIERNVYIEIERECVCVVAYWREWSAQLIINTIYGFCISNAVNSIDKSILITCLFND